MMYMKGVMGLDVDEICEATINIAVKLADLIDGKVKLVGNTIKSKKLPTYISSLEWYTYVTRIGYEFINEYYDTIEKIYNLEVPLSKMANKLKLNDSK